MFVIPRRRTSTVQMAKLSTMEFASEWILSVFLLTVCQETVCFVQKVINGSIRPANGFNALIDSTMVLEYALTSVQLVVNSMIK